MHFPSMATTISLGFMAVLIKKERRRKTLIVARIKNGHVQNFSVLDKENIINVHCTMSLGLFLKEKKERKERETTNRFQDFSAASAFFAQHLR